MIKSKKQGSKIIIVSLALLMCVSLFVAPLRAYAANPVAPPTVEAEIIGSLLRIRASAGFYAVEAVYINGRRFNHRVDSALVIDIGQYIATGDTIAIYAVDFAGNHSDTVLLTPPQPIPPPVPNNITPDGQGEVLDHLTDGDGVEFITITTPAGNIFHLIIDHTRDGNNVYFVNAVNEWDLMRLAEVAELPAPPHIVPPMPPTPPTIIEHEPPPYEPEPPVPEPVPEPDADDGGSGGILIFLGIAGVGAFGVIYYLKILKPRKEQEMYGGGDDGDEEEYEDIEIDYSDDNEYADSDTDGDKESGEESI